MKGQVNETRRLQIVRKMLTRKMCHEKKNFLLTYPAIDNTMHIVKFMNNIQFNFNPAILADVTRSSEYACKA